METKIPPMRPPVIVPCYAGIDPGKSDGVIVWSYPILRPNVGLFRVPLDCVVNIERLAKPGSRELWRQFSIIKRKGTPVICVMEKAGMHRAKNSAMSSAAAARHNGHLEMALTAIGAEFKIVQPKKWMDTLGPGRPKDRAERKTWIHEIVQERHPNTKIHKYAADAVAIFDYMLAEEGVEIDY